MSLSSLRQNLGEELLRFLWRQWSQLGVAGDAEFRDRWVIDPEALLVFSMDVGRQDPRLFDEVIDWTVRNGRWVSVQRLKNIAEPAGKETKRTLAAFAAVVDSRDTKHRWRAITKIHEADGGQTIPFFTDLGGVPIPTLGEADPYFGKYGLERSTVSIRNLSVPVPMQPRTNLLLKLRSLFGLAPRAEVIAYLMTHHGGKASVIARSAVYSYPPVSEALAELTQSGLVYVQRRGFYSTDIERWQRFLEVPGPLPLWMEWPRIFTALSTLREFTVEATKSRVSDYLLKSRALTLNETLRDTLSNTGIENPFVKPCNLDDAVEALTHGAEELIKCLQGAPC